MENCQYLKVWTTYRDVERLAHSGKAAILCVCRELSPFPGSLNETLNYRHSSPRTSEQGITYCLNSGYPKAFLTKPGTEMGLELSHIHFDSTLMTVSLRWIVLKTQIQQITSLFLEQLVWMLDLQKLKFNTAFK